MADNKNIQKLEQKIATYRYLFAQGNKAPTEEQVELWLNYGENGLRENEWEGELSIKEKVRRKIKLLRGVGIHSRAEILQSHLLRDRKKPLEGIDKYLKQMEIRAGGYTSDNSKEGTLLRVIIHDYITTKNQDALKAVTYLRSFQSIRSLVGEDFPEVLFDIEQLAHLGVNNEDYGIKPSRESYQRAMSSIRQKRAERERKGQTFDRVIFTNSCDDWEHKFLVAEIEAEVPSNASDHHRWNSTPDGMLAYGLGSLAASSKGKE
ncbi:hypothetical protein HYT55_04980, partial [Candidatus Woesearchaeota archaeon]|nr:hypothetical protein [Candidatus Woesearchaeota archaeon]